MRMMLLYALPVIFAFSGCATSSILIESDSPGASIYKAVDLSGPWQRIPDSYSTTPLTLSLPDSNRNYFLKAKKYGFTDSDAVPVSKLNGLEKYTFSLSLIMRDKVFDQFYDKSILQAYVKESDRKNIAIVGFSATPNVGAEVPGILTEVFQDIIVKTKAFNVVERRRIDPVLKELKLQQSGLTDTEGAASLGRILNAQEIFLGTVQSIGGYKIVSVSMVDVQTAKIIYSDAGQYETEKDMRDLALTLVNKLISTRFGTSPASI